MNNDRDQSVIDYILQMDSTIPNTQQPQQQQHVMIENQAPQQMASTLPTHTNNMTKSDLFEFYLGQEVNNVMDDNRKVQQQQQQTKRPAQMAVVDDDDKSTITAIGKRTKKINTGGDGAKALSGRLDFRPTMTDQVPESQLKSMSPRERRQLRNKISARNFRNRRKEYMSTLEEELDECKTENNKLHFELSTMQEKISQLENENKQLRLELVFYEQGINPATKSSSSSKSASSTSPSSISSSLSSAQNTNLSQFYPNNIPSDTTLSSSIELSPGTVYGLSSDSSASPSDLNILNEFTSALTNSHQPFYFDQQQQQQQSSMTSVWNLSTNDFNLHDMFLSHAMMPNWDVNRMLSKTNEHSSSPINNVNVMDTFQRYPLLAPALMSIVIGHTMTLSTNDLLTLNLPTNTTTNNDDKLNLKIWELLQPLTTRRKSITATEEQPIEETTTKKENDDDTTDDGDQQQQEQKCLGTAVVAYCHRYLKSYICASVHYYLEQCSRQGSEQVTEDTSDDKNNNKNDDDYTTTTPERKEFTPLCKRFRRAKELFIPVA